MLWALLTIGLNSAAQLLLKYSSITDSLSSQYFKLPFLAAAAIYGTSVITWTLALRELPLSAAYPLTAFGFVIVPVAARFIFSETINTGQWLFLSMIVIGISGFALSTNSN